MARRTNLEDSLDALRKVREDPHSPASLAILKTALESKSCHAVQRAAEIASECELGEIVAELASAFQTFMDLSAEKDKNCVAKTALAQALYTLDWRDATLYERGLRHSQMEPGWPAPEDSAGSLRATCAQGLAYSRGNESLPDLAENLHDKLSIAREGAVRAIATVANAGSLALLRYKSLVGDEDLNVISACFAGLLEADFSGSQNFVTRFLNDPDASVCEIAAINLGATRKLEALEVLRAWFDSISSVDLRKTALLSIATIGRPESTDYLLELVADSPPREAILALEGLSIYFFDEGILDRCRTAVKKRGDLVLPGKLAKPLK